MMRYKKKPLTGKSTIKHVVFDRFSTISADDGNGTLGAVEALNCTTVDGTLQAGVGLAIHTMDNGNTITYDMTEPREYFMYEDMDIGLRHMGIIVDTGTRYVNEETSEVLPLVNYACRMRMYNCINKDFQRVLLAVGDWGIYSCTENGDESTSSLMGIQCSCVCKDRLFALQVNYMLRYSTPLNYLSFNETGDDSGVFYLPQVYGEPMDMIAYNDCVYILYAHYILELQVAGAARDFKLSEITYVGGKIIEHSAKVFGDKLIFLAEDGVYMFDGKTVRKAYEKLRINPLKDGQAVGYAACGGKMLLRYVNNNRENKTVALYPDGEYGYFTTFMRGLGTYKGQTFCLFNNKFYNVMEGATIPSGEFRYFRSVAQDFGVKGRKTLKSIHFEGDKTAQFDLYVDGVQKVHNAHAKYDENGQASFHLDLRGEEFSFVIYVSTGSKLWRMTAEVEYV